MTLHGLYWETLGDGTARVHAHTEAGSDIDVVMGLDLLGSETMYEVLQERGAQVDAQREAIAAREGRTEHD